MSTSVRPSTVWLPSTRGSAATARARSPVAGSSSNRPEPSCSTWNGRPVSSQPSNTVLTQHQRGQLAAYARLLRASPHNLLSTRGLAELESRHLPESVALAGLLPQTPDRARARLLDVGSGGGLPGLVIAIVRLDLEVTLLEATGKKAAFLQATATTLGVGVTVVTERAEHAAAGPLAGSFDLVTARAVAPLERLIPLTLPFTRPDGAVYAIKGAHWRAELDAAQPALRRHRGVVLATPDDLIPRFPQGFPQVEGRTSPMSAPLVVILGRR